MTSRIRFTRALAASAIALAASAGIARATDLIGILPAALDQPRIDAAISRGVFGTGTLLMNSNPEYSSLFDVTAFFDTGASGVLLSEATSDALGVQRQVVNGSKAIFSDVGVGASSTAFNISEPLYIGLAKYHPSADIDNPATYTTAYNQTFGPIRAQVGPLGVDPDDPNLAGLDVFGTPTMQGKVVVMDPKPVNSFLDTMRTYVYNPGTAYDSAKKSSEPGIPVLNDPDLSRHLKLTYGDFGRFTTTSPGAEAPTLAGNPFIGPNPVHQIDASVPAGDAPAVKLSFGSLSTSGSMLLDTGAAASMISTNKAGELHVRYRAGTQGTDNPVLEKFDPAHPENPGTIIGEQFTLPIGGIGGTSMIAGFYLDSMLLRTEEGNVNVDSDAKHLNFKRSPVLVNDITLNDGLGHTLTLDGIFGMNNLVASADVTFIPGEESPIVTGLNTGKFDWAVFDQPNAELGLQLATAATAEYLIWTGFNLSGGDSRDWDVDNTDNWYGTSYFETYQDGSKVIFDDSGAEPRVRLRSDVAPAFVQFDNSDDEDTGVNYQILGSYAITGSTGVLKTNSGTVTFFNQNRYTGTTNVLSGGLVFLASQDIGPVRVHDGGTILFAASQKLKSISLEGGSVYIDANGSRLIRTESVTMLGGGTLDLNNNPMQLTSTTLAAVQSLVGSGRNHGAWNGAGITSSTAKQQAQHVTTLGILKGSEFKDSHGAGATFYGQSVADGDVLVKYVYYGDSDFSGKIDFDDYARIDNGFNHQLEQNAKIDWYTGDFDYNGRIDFDDYALIDFAFNSQSGTLARAVDFLNGDTMSIGLDAAGLQIVQDRFAEFGLSYAQSFIAAVPEPGSAMMFVGMMAMTSLRPRRASK